MTWEEEPCASLGSFQRRRSCCFQVRLSSKAGWNTSTGNNSSASIFRKTGSKDISFRSRMPTVAAPLWRSICTPAVSIFWTQQCLRGRRHRHFSRPRCESSTRRKTGSVTISTPPGNGPPSRNRRAQRATIAAGAGVEEIYGQEYQPTRKCQPTRSGLRPISGPVFFFRRSGYTSGWVSPESGSTGILV